MHDIDFAYRLNIAEHYEKVCYYAKFPFAGNSGNFIFDSNAGINTTKELLPGSMLDMFCCSRFVALENKDFSAALCCIDAPVVEFDDMHTCEWRKKLPLTFKNNHIYGLLYNNICNTDAPAWQRIIDTFNYSLFINDGKFSPAAAQAAWYSINALEAELAFEKSNDGIEGFPLELRVHSDAYGAVFLENLTDGEVIFKDKKIPPHALIKAE